MFCPVWLLIRRYNTLTRSKFLRQSEGILGCGDVPDSESKITERASRFIGRRLWFRKENTGLTQPPQVWITCVSLTGRQFYLSPGRLPAPQGV
jgi:hypothetical protein